MEKSQCDVWMMVWLLMNDLVFSFPEVVLERMILQKTFTIFINLIK